MSSLNIPEWFSDKWMRLQARWVEDKIPWDSLSRPDQVLFAVGYILETIVGGNGWDLIEDMKTPDLGMRDLALKTPDAFSSLGYESVARQLKKFIELSRTSGDDTLDAANHEQAEDVWSEISKELDVWDDERVVLKDLYRWYQKHAATE